MLDLTPFGENPMIKPIEISDADFQSRVLDSPEPVLVDFWAPWCGPCRAVAPVLEQIANERAGKLVVAKVNVDDHSANAGRLGVQGIPTMILFVKGRERARIVGAQDKTSIVRQIDEAIAGTRVG
jgi:thioredoxin 1